MRLQWGQHKTSSPFSSKSKKSPWHYSNLHTSTHLYWGKMNFKVIYILCSSGISNACLFFYILYLKGSYDAILKIIILCIWCNRICWYALMFKKHIIFQMLYIIVGPICPTSLKRFVFYKAPPSNKCSLLWLANWPSALWLAEHLKHASEM